MEELVEEDDDEGGGDELDDEEKTDACAEVGGLAIEACEDVNGSLTERDDEGEYYREVSQFKKRGVRRSDGRF